MKEWLDCCMDVCSSYRIRQWYWTWKAFLSIKNYFYQHQNITIIIKGESETGPNFWNRHNNSLSKVYWFIWSCRVFFYHWTCFSHLAFLVCFLAVVSFVIFRILRQQLQEKNKQPKIFSSHRAQCETLAKGWLKITRVNFTRKPPEVNYPSADWLSYLLFVGGVQVCLRRRKIFQRCFLETIFSPEGDTLKSYKSKGICSIVLKFWQ